MSDLNVSIDQGVCQIEIARLTKRNALDANNCATFVEVLAQAQKDDNVHCVVIRGQEAIFCAGADLKETLERSPESQSAYDALIEALIAFDKPLLAAVQGPCLGLGVAILSYCDMAYCSEKTLFSMPFTALGLTPEYGLSQIAMSKAGYQKASEKLLLSEPISAIEASEMGFITGICKPEDVLQETLNRAVRLAQMPLGSLRATKKLLRRHLAQQIRSTLVMEKEQTALRLQTAETKEAITAFQEGRKPDFSRC